VRITTILPSTGFERPSSEQLRELLRRVLEEHELPAISEAQFSRAFWATGFQFRLEAPDVSLHFHSHVDSANNLLSQYGYGEIDGAAALAAIVAHSDIPYRLANRDQGQLLEVALNPFSGIKCTNRWRAVLAGEPLREPLPPKGIPRHQTEVIPRPKFYEEGIDGKMREYEVAPLLRR
jgi:hypothetical protein